jgi:hypothetical protein
MPYEVSLDLIPAGVALSSARKGEQVTVAALEFSSSEDGDAFIQRLEGIPNDLLAKLPPEAGIGPSAIDHLLAIIRKDKTATIYVNELSFLLKIRAKQAKKPGEPIYQDDIADVESLGLGNVTIPADAGLLFIFSIGWRKGLFFDFGPLQITPTTREYNIEALLGHYYGYLAYQHLFKITDDEWQQLFAQQWFPFITLKNSSIRKMLSYIRNHWPVDDLLPDIASEISKAMNDMLARWSQNPLLQSHIELIRHAVDRYLQKDFVSATAILYTRIEGIMRSVYLTTGVGSRASPKNLVASVVEPQQARSYGFSLLLPHMFRKYLEEVYFHNFEPGKPAPLSRHSVAHGIAAPEDFSVKGATIGMLIIDQLFFFLSADNSQTKQAE